MYNVAKPQEQISSFYNFNKERNHQKRNITGTLQATGEGKKCLQRNGPASIMLVRMQQGKGNPPPLK